MTTTVRCPCCDRLVGIPEEPPPPMRVRCPLCGGSFPRSEARPSEEQSPDLLLEVAPAEDEQPNDQAQPAEETPAAAPTGSATEEYALAAPTDPLPQQAKPPRASDADLLHACTDLVVRCPHCHSESRLGEVVVAAMDQPLDAVSLADALETLAEDRPLFGLQKSAQSADQLPAIPESQGAGSPPAARTWQRESDTGKVGRVIGVLLGGLLALPIAYYVLNLIGGEQFDWFSVPLPFASHTYQHLPQWWPRWATPRSQDNSKPDSPEDKQPSAKRRTVGWVECSGPHREHLPSPTCAHRGRDEGTLSQPLACISLRWPHPTTILARSQLPRLPATLHGNPPGRSA